MLWGWCSLIWPDTLSNRMLGRDMEERLHFAFYCASVSIYNARR